MFGLKEKKADFERVPDSEDCEGLLSPNERSLIDSLPSRVSSRGPSWLVAAITIFSTAIISAGIGAWIAQMGRFDADSFSIRHTSQYSPIVKDVGVTYHNVRFNGSLLKTNAFRLDAGPEVDAAWKSLGADCENSFPDHAARIPVEEAARSGLAPDQVKVQAKYGGGYPAHVEGLHHLHCLNLLRKSLAWNFDYYQAQGLGPFSNEPHIVKHHITHCLDILRQQLMCTVDVGVLGQVWFQPPGKPIQAFVDFNTEHKCRNFEAIRDWAEEHQLPDADQVPADFLEPPKNGDRIYDEVP